MSDKMTLTFRWDEASFKKAFESAYRYRYTHSIRRYIGWGFIALAQFGVVALLKQEQPGLLLFATLMLAYWYGLKKRLLWLRAKRAFESSPLRNRTIRLQADDEGLTQDGIKIPWETLDGVVSVENGVMVMGNGNDYIIPESAFDSIEAMSRFKSWAKEKGKLYAA